MLLLDHLLNGDNGLFIKGKTWQNLRYKHYVSHTVLRISVRAIKAGVHLNGIFAPLNAGLVQISRSHFKQSKNSMLKTKIYVIGCFVFFF